jgi:hypothetical protein
MNRVTFPLKHGNHGATVTNLHDGLQLMLDLGSFDMNEDKRVQLQAGRCIDQY